MRGRAVDRSQELVLEEAREAMPYLNVAWTDDLLIPAAPQYAAVSILLPCLIGWCVYRSSLAFVLLCNKRAELFIIVTSQGNTVLPVRMDDRSSDTHSADAQQTQARHDSADPASTGGGCCRQLLCRSILHSQHWDIPSLPRSVDSLPRSLQVARCLRTCLRYHGGHFYAGVYGTALLEGHKQEQIYRSRHGRQHLRWVWGCDLVSRDSGLSRYAKDVHQQALLPHPGLPSWKHPSGHCHHCYILRTSVQDETSLKEKVRLLETL